MNYDNLEEALGASFTTAKNPGALVVDSELRTIQIPSNYILGVYNDKDVLTLPFQIPRFYHGTDLSEFEIKINYMNASGIGNYADAKNVVVADDAITFDWLLGAGVFAESGTVTFVICIRKLDSTGKILKEFNTTRAVGNVLEGLEVEDQEDPEQYSILFEMRGYNESARTQAENAAASATLAKAYVGAPLTANTAAAMTDKTRVYVYTGSETGYTAGNWYYHDGSIWQSGGTYNSSAVETDKSLSISDKAADAKTVGDEIESFRSYSTNKFSNLELTDESIKDSIDDLKADLTQSVDGVKNALDYSGNFVYDKCVNGRNYRVNQPLYANVPLYFMPVSSTNQNATGLGIYGYKQDGTAVSIGSANFGEIVKLIPSQDYVWFNVVNTPWVSADFTFDFLYTTKENGVIGTLLSVLPSYRPSGTTSIDVTNYQTFFTDANLAPRGKTFFIRNNVTSDHISNLPVYNTFGILFTINSLQNNVHGIMQLYCTSQNMWFRFETGSGDSYSFSNWRNVVQDLESEIKAYVNGLFNLANNGHFESTASATIINQRDLQVGKEYNIFIWNLNNLTSVPCYIFLEDGSYQGVPIYKNVSDTTIYRVTIPSGYSFVRLYGNRPSGLDSSVVSSCDWAFADTTGGILNASIAIGEIESGWLMNSLNRTTCKIFKKVVCCGDSYTSGHIQTSEDSSPIPTNEEFAYPHYMSTLTGNQWINCGSSGANVLTWQTSQRGLIAARAAGQAQAYVIGLMINDASTGGNHVDLGTETDIGTDAQTYYGGLSKIIRELNTISPTAKIFVNTCPRTGTTYAQYNQAVRNIVEAYKSTYPVYCIDLAENIDLYSNASLTGDAVNGHHTAIGYEQFAEIYAYVLSNYINTHITDFQNVHKIPYSN